MPDFLECERAFRERFGYAPEIPHPWVFEAWADVLKESVETGSDRPYREAFAEEERIRQESSRLP
ncbi:MAG: hypothetical protein OXJ63_06950 [Gammaproteobacteria bacterium]|nr:hypothetical protein [Gammaproteobacteria bacterium]MDE0455036.1 hypothetical protein [Gammaproteobacteria bacterium]